MHAHTPPSLQVYTWLHLAVQEYYLHALSQPRPHPTDIQVAEAEAAEGSQPPRTLETMFSISRSPFSASNLNALSRRMSHAMVEAVHGG